MEELARIVSSTYTGGYSEQPMILLCIIFSVYLCGTVILSSWGRIDEESPLDGNCF
jgi:hypothetical protein